MTVKRLEVLILGTDAGATATMKKVEGGADSMGSKLSKVGGVVAASAAGMGVAFTGYAVKSALSMETVDSKLAAHGDLSSLQATKIGNAFLHTGSQFTFTGQEMVEALAPVSGQLKLMDGHVLTNAESLKVMSSSANLAESTGAALGTTTKSLVAVMQAYGLQATDAGMATDVLWNVSKSTGIGVDQLATTFERLHSKLGPNTPTMAQLGGTLIDLTSHGVSGRAAITGLSTGLTTLLGSGKNTKDMAKALGLQVYDSTGKFVGMRSVIAQLGPHLKGMSDQQRNAALSALFGKSAAAILSTTLTDGVTAYDKSTAAAGRAGTAHAAAEKSTANFSGTIKKLEVEFKNTATIIGEKVVPWLTKMVTWVGTSVTWFTKHKAVLIAVASVIGVGLVAAFGAWAFSAASAAAATLAAAAPIIAVVAAIGLLVAGLVYAYNHWSAFHDAVQAVVGWLRDTAWPIIKQFAADFVAGFKVVVDWVKAHWPEVQAVISSVVDTIKRVITTQIGWVQTFWKDFGTKIIGFVKSDWKVISNEISLAIDLVKGIITVALDVIQGKWGKAWDAVKSTFSKVWSDITGIVSGVAGMIWNVLSGLFTGAGKIIGAGLNGIVNFFSQLPGRIGNVLSGLFSAITQPFRDAWNWIANKWDSITIPSVHIPGTNITIGGGQLPQLPTFHQGGVYRSPVPGGEGLAVLRDRETILTPEQARNVRKSVPAAQNVTLLLDGKVLAQVTTSHQLQADRSQGRKRRVA